MGSDSGFLFKPQGGSGQYCLLIHGFASDGLSWGANLPALLPLADTVSVEWPAHGDNLSSVIAPSLVENSDQFVQAMQHHGINEAHLIGHSLGGGLAVAVAAAHPGRVASLTLVAPAGLGSGVNAALLQQLVEARKPEEALSALQQLFVRKQLVNKLLVKRLLDHLNKPGIRSALAELANNLASWEQSELPDMLVAARGSRPMQIFWGADDIVHQADSTKVQKLGASLNMLQQAGHLPHVEHANAFNAALATQLMAKTG